MRVLPVLILLFLGPALQEQDLENFGARGSEIFRFKPLAAGDHEVSFELVRPVEGKAVERKEFLVHVAD